MSKNLAAYFETSAGFATFGWFWNVESMLTPQLRADFQTGRPVGQRTLSEVTFEIGHRSDVQDQAVAEADGFVLLEGLWVLEDQDYSLTEWKGKGSPQSYRDWQKVSHAIAGEST